jgi:hypothetical protein
MIAFSALTIAISSPASARCATMLASRPRSIPSPLITVAIACSPQDTDPAALGIVLKQLLDFLGSNLFVYHGFVELYLEGKWVKATPAFNSSLCQRHHVRPLQFDGREDSLFQAYNLENQRFMEYIAFHRNYADIPVKRIVAAWKKAYGKDRVEDWIKRLAEGNDRSLSDFAKEEVLNK